MAGKAAETDDARLARARRDAWGMLRPHAPALLLALCLMMLTPGLALGLWLLAIAARGGGWRLPRLVPWVVAALDVAGLPPPFERQLTVLRI